jgi:hypothetical protein
MPRLHRDIANASVALPPAKPVSWSSLRAALAAQSGSKAVCDRHLPSVSSTIGLSHLAKINSCSENLESARIGFEQGLMTSHIRELAALCHKVISAHMQTSIDLARIYVSGFAYGQALQDSLLD